MINGTYRIVMRTLLGNRSGQISLFENNNVLTGTIEILNHQTEIREGSIRKGKCVFSGEFITPVRNIPFTAEGKINQKNISLKVKAGLLDLYISGEEECRDVKEL